MKKILYIISGTLFAIIVWLGIYLLYPDSGIKDIRSKEDLKSKHGESEVWLSDLRVDQIESEHAQIIDISEIPLDDDFTKRIAALIEENISEIIKKKPVYGGQWVVTTLRFIDSGTVFVGYEDGHESFDSQIKIIERGKDFSFEVVK
jgi:hypothetical protein